MPLPTLMSVALKEWATVCDALGSGRQIMLLRKGGISESMGQFHVEHREFLVFPTYLHQNLAMLKPEAQAGFKPHSAEPELINISLAGDVTDIVRVGSRAEIDALDAEHIWEKPLIDMRFNYKPQLPLYVLLVRAYQLAKRVTIRNTPAYAGCKSWVPLEEPIDITGATPVLDNGAYESRCAKVLAAMRG